jgi:hypothetical protein
MSSWHLPTLHMTIVRDGIVQHKVMTKEEADKFIERLAKMNAYALKCRYGYGERVKATKVHSAMCYNITMPALIKMLQCVRYQCYEGDTDTKHKTTWNMLNSTIGKLCEQIYDETIDRNNNTKLPWAIFDKDEMASYDGIVWKVKPAVG